MKKRFIFFLGLILIFALYACSSDDTSGNDNDVDNNGNTEKNENNENNENEEEENDAEASEDQVTLTIGLPGGYDITAKEIMDGFREKHPEINLEDVEAPWTDFVAQIATRIAGDTAPDLWLQENAVVLGFGDRGAAEDLRPYIERDLNEDDYIDALFAAETPDGEIYGVPHGINPLALAYNEKIFDEADIPYPTDDWTYNDIIETGKKLTQDTNGDGEIDVYGYSASGNIVGGWLSWIRAAGGQVLDDSLTQSMVTEPEALEGITAWKDTIHKHKIGPSKSFREAADDLFGDEQVAMTFLQYNQQIKYNRDFPDLEFDTVQMPKTFDGEDRNVPAVVNSWIMYSKSDSEVKEAAWEFLKYYLSEEPQMILAESGASLPVEKNALETVEGMTDTRPYNKTAYTQGVEESGRMIEDSPTWEEWYAAAQPVFEDILYGILEPEEGLEEANKKIQDILDE